MPPITEIAYFTEDVAAMRAFYARLLGSAPITESRDMAIFLVDGVKIFIHRTYIPGADDLPPEDHTTFAVPDVDAAYAELQRHGLTGEVAPADYYWGRSAYLRDPDGHLIELNQPAEEA
jgi:catechol 2,3-dioxygenase-like lactoylglutathione lyase family enzyme